MARKFKSTVDELMTRVANNRKWYKNTDVTRYMTINGEHAQDYGGGTPALKLLDDNEHRLIYVDVTKTAASFKLTFYLGNKKIQLLTDEMPYAKR